MMLLVFLGGSLLLKGIRIVWTCSNILNNLKPDVFKVDLLIFITSIPFPTYQVLVHYRTASSTVFKYPLEFLLRPLLHQTVPHDELES